MSKIYYLLFIGNNFSYSDYVNNTNPVYSTHNNKSEKQRSVKVFSYILMIIFCKYLTKKISDSNKQHTHTTDKKDEELWDNHKKEQKKFMDLMKAQHKEEIKKIKNEIGNMDNQEHMKENVEETENKIKEKITKYFFNFFNKNNFYIKYSKTINNSHLETGRGYNHLKISSLT